MDILSVLESYEGLNVGLMHGGLMSLCTVRYTVMKLSEASSPVVEDEVLRPLCCGRLKVESVS